MSDLFTVRHLPPLVTGRSRLLAQPRPGMAFACVWAGRDAKIHVMRPEEARGKPWPTHVHVAKSELHMLMDLNGEHAIAPDVRFGSERPTYELTADNLPIDDARGAYLRGMWAQHRECPEVMVVRRIRPFNIVGQVALTSSILGRRFKGGPTNYYTLEPGAYIVYNHDGVHSVVPERVMRRMVDRLTLQGGATVHELAPVE